MTKNAYKSVIFVLVFGLLAAACTPMTMDEGETQLETPGVVVDTPEAPVVVETPETPLVPDTGADPAGQTPEAALQEPTATATPEPAVQPVPVTGEELAEADDYEEFYGMRVYDQDDNFLGILEHVVEGPQGLSDFALVSTWENLYRTIPVTAMNVNEAAGRINFEGELHQFMGSPTFEAIQGLNFNIEQVRNAVIGYWQHQVDINQ
jgi:hypothetical protein